MYSGLWTKPFFLQFIVFIVFFFFSIWSQKYLFNLQFHRVLGKVLMLQHCASKSYLTKLFPHFFLLLTSQRLIQITRLLMPTWSAERRWSSLWGTSSSCEEGRRRWCRPTPWCRATTSSSARKCCRSSPAMSLVYYLWSAAGGGVVSKHWEHCLPSGELGTTAFSLGVSSLRSRGRPGIWAAAYALARVEMRTNNSIKMQSSPLLPIITVRMSKKFLKTIKGAEIGCLSCKWCEVMRTWSSRSAVGV